MSAATRATTARERANIAANYIRGYATDSRAFADCFEMGDGDEVMRILRQMRSAPVAAYCARIDEREIVERRIADALMTGERGDNLVAVARNAAAAEMELASITRERESE